MGIPLWDSSSSFGEDTRNDDAKSRTEGLSRLARKHALPERRSGLFLGRETNGRELNRSSSTIRISDMVRSMSVRGRFVSSGLTRADEDDIDAIIAGIDDLDNGRELESLDHTAREDMVRDVLGEHEEELEPLGQTYVARQYRLGSPSSHRVSLVSAAESGPGSTSIDNRLRRVFRDGVHLESDMAVNRSLEDYVRRLRGISLRADDEMVYESNAFNGSLYGDLSLTEDDDVEDDDRINYSVHGTRTIDQQGHNNFSSIVDQIRDIGTEQDFSIRRSTSSNNEVNNGSGPEANQANSVPPRRLLSPLDLDGFYSSRARLRQNRYAFASVSHTADSADHDVLMYNYHCQNDILDERLDIIRMARRELRRMQLDTMSSLDHLNNVRSI
ncbi:hypothetical protein V1511DRAFT_502098 [Dipodascopsis uninucleata]